MNENENLQNPVPSTGRKLNTNRLKEFMENNDALEGALASEKAKPETAPKKPVLRVKGRIPRANSDSAAEEKKVLNPNPSVPVLELDDDFINPASLNLGNTSESEPTESEIGSGGQDPIEEDEPKVAPGIDLSAIKESIKNKLTNIFKKEPLEYEDEYEDEYEEEEEPEVRVTATEELPENDKKYRKGCGIIAGLTLGAIIVLIGGRRVVKWLNERTANNALDTTPSATTSPDAETVPDDALVNPDDLVTPEPTATPEVIFNPETIAHTEYSFLHSYESATEQINLPYDEDSILNLVYALNPSLNKGANLDIGEASSICNNISANTITNNKKSNLYSLLNCDTEIKSLLATLEDAAIKVKLDNFNGEAETLGLYNEEQKTYAESQGVNISDDKYFFETLQKVVDKVDVNDPKNVGIWVIIDAIHNGTTPNLNIYINHYAEGAEAETNFRMMEEKIFSDESLTKFAEINTEEVIPEVEPEVAEAKGNSYYRYLQNIEQEHGVTFNIDEETIKNLTSYLNGEGEYDPKEAKEIFEEIAKTCKSAGVSPAFDTLVKNEKYAKLLSDIEKLLSVLKVDYDYNDDKALYNYLIVNLMDQRTALINYMEEDQIAVFMAIMGMYENYQKETYNYTWNGKNGELVGNNDPYLSCAMGVEDSLYAEYDAIVDLYKKQSLKR